ncbi:MAG: RNA-binding transcriptional accessory protein [Bacteroidia bacterium]|nr:RNA-binding transcriptional accessory protein [Bacteroidia bacterium]
MEPEIVKLISNELNCKEWQINNVVKLFEGGATIPFISRYRKEMTGSLDELVILNIKELVDKYQTIEKRKITILETIKESGKLTDELQKTIVCCYILSELEDLYLPFKPKRKSRAEIARSKGLEPLAEYIFMQKNQNILQFAQSFIKNEISNIEEAIAGAKDIIAEKISEDIRARNLIRNLFKYDAIINSRLIKTKESEAAKYTDYFNLSEKLVKCPSHRILAMRRGESEGYLKIRIEIDNDIAISKIIRLFVTGNGEASKQVSIAAEDAYKRLICPSIENEFATLSKEKADKEAIRVFGENLKQLLLLPPLGNKRVLAIDPGFRTGCKVVCINEQGNILFNETIYPHPPQKEIVQASKKITSIVNAYKIECVAIGNATAGRETENFIKNVRFDKPVKVYMVSEAGASVYSASSVAREELPQYDVTVRGAVSIGRRLQDPLAELVKIDPKSIGVGQYQHDVDQTLLKNNLDNIVEECVNKVGVNINTSNRYLLSYVSGIGPLLAKNINEYCEKNGPFKSRADLLKVPRFGEKAFELAAGFLRIPGAENPLDNTSVHPERYKLVSKICSDLKCTIENLVSNKELIGRIKIENYISDEVGLPTLTDVVTELEKPGRDIRMGIKIFEFASDVFTIDDLRPGMILPGIITNVTNFGAFVDIGIKQNGLVHISNICNEYITNPADKVTLNQHVKVKVLEVDKERGRIQLSMKDNG